MFDKLTNKFTELFSSLKTKKNLTEENLTEAVKKVRLALLDADVNYSVASQFVKKVKSKAIGTKFTSSVSPGDQFVKIIHDELIRLMGSNEEDLKLSKSLSIVLVCGLQGSGKTTTAGKLAYYLQKKKKKVLAAACDLQRPAAIEQLRKVCSEKDIPVFAIEGENNPIKVAKKALEKAENDGTDVLIIDTAGRLHIDEKLMNELTLIREAIKPQEVLYVASAATGQDAVKTAQQFNQRIEITGSVLTMLDGNSRAGAAISIAEITQKPLKFEGNGEKIDDFQVFSPRSMADRVLGMGDIVNLVKKADEAVDESEKAKLEKKMLKASFTYDDYLKQMGMIKKMGSLKNLIKMIPGLPPIGDLDTSEKEFAKTEAIIKSMTKREREEKVELTPSRRRRIAKGSGTGIEDVNRLVKGFKKLKKLLKSMPKSMKSLSKLKETMQWQ